MIQKLGLSRNQYGFLTDDHDAIDQFEILFDRSNQFETVDGGSNTGTVTMDSMDVLKTVTIVYSASGGPLTVNLPTKGTFSVFASVTVDNTFTTSPNTKVGRNVTGVLVAAMASGSSLFAVVTRLT